MNHIKHGCNKKFPFGNNKYQVMEAWHLLSLPIFMLMTNADNKNIIVVIHDINDQVRAKRVKPDWRGYFKTFSRHVND